MKRKTVYMSNPDRRKRAASPLPCAPPEPGLIRDVMKIIAGLRVPPTISPLWAPKNHTEHEQQNADTTERPDEIS